MFKLKKEIPDFSFVEYWKRSTIMTIVAEKVSITWPRQKNFIRRLKRKNHLVQHN